MRAKFFSTAALTLAILVGLQEVSTLAQAQGQNPVNDTCSMYRKTVWVGTETLPGYGRLEFHFYDNGTAVMIDVHETAAGTFERNGASITVTFPGRAVYAGTINDNTMSGTARDATRTWSWIVFFQREG